MRFIGSASIYAYDAKVVIDPKSEGGSSNPLHVAKAIQVDEDGRLHNGIIEIRDNRPVATKGQYFLFDNEKASIMITNNDKSTVYDLAKAKSDFAPWDAKGQYFKNKGVVIT